VLILSPSLMPGVGVIAIEVVIIGVGGGGHSAVVVHHHTTIAIIGVLVIVIGRVSVKHLQSPPCFWVLLRRKRGQVRREEVQLRKEEMQVRRRGGQVLQGRSSAPEGEEGRHRGVRALASAYVLRPWTGSALVFRRSGVMTEE